jgi:Fe-S-cluster-containing hydrogenase component 2
MSIGLQKLNRNPAIKREFFGGAGYAAAGRLGEADWLRISFCAFDGRNYALPVLCVHCTHAACVEACPENALSPVNGWVRVNRDRCIGCGRCERACPYQAIHVSRQVNLFGLHAGKAVKCDGCTGDSYQQPACASVCATGAMQYGYRHKLVRQAHKRVRSLKKEFPQACLYGLSPYGGLQVLYVLTGPPEQFGLGAAGAVDVSSAADIRSVYTLFSVFSFGLSSLRRRMVQLAEKIVG